MKHKIWVFWPKIPHGNGCHLVNIQLSWIKLVPNSWYSGLLANHSTQQATSRILVLKIW